LVVVLPDLPDLEAMLDGPDGLLAGARELLLVVSSTVSPDGVRTLDARLRAATDGRVRVVDAPVSGGAEGAEGGTLSIMVGGPDDDAALALEALSPCGRVEHLGPLGA